MSAAALQNLGLSQPVPDDYDEYYLQIVKICLRYACPVGAALYIGFFGWDLMFLSDTPSLMKTLAVRIAFCIVGMTFWLFAPRIKSLKTMMLGISGLYLFAMLGLCAIL